jgi:hypothetical protein
MMNFEETRNLVKKILLIGVFVLAALLIIWAIVYATGKGQVTVKKPKTFDYEVKFSFDGTEYTTPKTFSGIVGQHTITAKVDGTRPFEQIIEVKKFENKVIELSLTPINPLDEALGNSEPASNSQKLYEKALKTNPLIQYLPVFNKDYNFVFDMNYITGEINYYIEMNDREKETMDTTMAEVRNFISSKGIDPNSIIILWREKTL